jgi:DNA sulfur modification protein DndD
MSGSDNGSVRFDSLRLSNYRVYREAQFVFPGGSAHDLHAVVGHGGCGKTNLMNAMSWCLYGKERYVPSKSEGLPIGYRPLGGTVSGSSPSVNVELKTSRRDPNSSVVIVDSFTRSQGGGDSGFGHFQVRDGEVVLTNDSERASREVNKLIPSEMSWYYFFDGEKIQDFLFGQATSNVEPALSYLSRIRLLQTTMDHLTSLQTDLQRQFARNNPAMLSLVDEKDRDSEQLKNLKSRLDGLERERGIAREERDRYDQLLHSQGGAADLPERQTKLEAQKTALEGRVKTGESAYRSALYRVAGHVFVQPAMSRFDALVAEKEGRNELPPPVEPSLLERILSEGTCISGRRLDRDVGCREGLEALLRQVKDVSDLGSAVGPIRQHVSFVERLLEREPHEVRTLRKSWTDLRQDLEDVSRELVNVKLELLQVDVDQIRQAQKNRQVQQELYDKYANEIAGSKAEIQPLEKRLEEHERAIDIAQKKEVALEGCKARLAVVNSAIDIAREVLNQRTEMVRSYVSERFGEAFQEMMWQKNLYSSAFLDESYRIHVIHAGGGEALATMGESEKEVAAIAFILALHEVSGYQGPLVVDFPFGRTTGKMTDQIAEVLKSLSQDRQVILLMTDTEYAATQAILQPFLASRHRLVRRYGETIVEADA